MMSLRRLASLPLILAVALLLRVLFLWSYVTSHQARALATIPFLFEPGNIAFSIANGHGFSSPFRADTGPTAWMTPLYPFLLAAIFRIFGIYTLQAFIAAASFNVLCSTLTCVPVWFVANRIAAKPESGRNAAALATWLWAVFPNAVILPYESMWEASLSALLATTLLWATFAVAESEKRRDWCAYGALWGIGLMTNAALISLLPFLFGWAEYRAHGRKTYQVRRPALAAAVALLCCVPWTVRNYVRFHAFVPLRSVAGLALWMGNNEQAQSNSVSGLHPISSQAEREKYVEMGEIAYMKEKQNLAIAYMFSHPREEASMMLERFTTIWTGGSTSPIRDLAGARTVRFYLVILFNSLAALGALLGVIVLWRDQSPWRIPLTAFPAAFPLVYYLVLAPPRYRHPIDPALLLLTAIAVTHLRKYHQRPVRPIRFKP